MDLPKHYYILSEICVTNVLQGETKKDLHSCKSLIVNAPHSFVLSNLFMEDMKKLSYLFSNVKYHKKL